MFEFLCFRTVKNFLLDFFTEETTTFLIYWQTWKSVTFLVFWKLFIDSSKTSLTALLLHKFIVLFFVPVSQVGHVKETFQNIKQLLKYIHYSLHYWSLCGDLTVVAVLFGLCLNFIVGTTRTVDLSVSGKGVQEMTTTSKKTDRVSHYSLTLRMLSLQHL